MPLYRLQSVYPSVVINAPTKEIAEDFYVKWIEIDDNGPIMTIEYEVGPIKVNCVGELVETCAICGRELMLVGGCTSDDCIDFF